MVDRAAGWQAAVSPATTTTSRLGPVPCLRRWSSMYTQLTAVYIGTSTSQHKHSKYKRAELVASVTRQLTVVLSSTSCGCKWRPARATLLTHAVMVTTTPFDCIADRSEGYHNSGLTTVLIVLSFKRCHFT